LKETSGGIDNGEDPIFERYGVEVEKALAVVGDWKAGRRNEGNDTEGDGFALAAMLCAHRRRAGPHCS